MADYQRPDGYETEKKDCTVRALSLVSNLPYQEVHSAFKKAGRKDKHAVKTKYVFQQVCKSLNLNATLIKRSGSLFKLMKEYPIGKIFCLKRGHAFALIDGVSHDEESNARIKAAWLITKVQE